MHKEGRCSLHRIYPVPRRRQDSSHACYSDADLVTLTTSLCLVETTWDQFHFMYSSVYGNSSVCGPLLEGRSETDCGYIGFAMVAGLCLTCIPPPSECYSYYISHTEYVGRYPSILKIPQMGCKFLQIQNSPNPKSSQQTNHLFVILWDLSLTYVNSPFQKTSKIILHHYNHLSTF